MAVDKKISQLDIEAPDDLDLIPFLDVSTGVTKATRKSNIGGAGGGVAGSDTQVQFNDGGSMGAEAAFTYQKTTNTLTVENIDSVNDTVISISGRGDGYGVGLYGSNGTTSGSSGGYIDMLTGSATLGNAFGGYFNLQTGNGSGSSRGGDIGLYTGSGGATGDAGFMQFYAGNGGATSGAGGTIEIQAGDATAGNSSGGNLWLTSGLKQGAGSNGYIRISSNRTGSSTRALLDTSSLATTDKTFTFPNATGTFALVSDLSAYQPLDSDLTSIAGLSASNDDFIQRKAGAWTNRTIAQIKSDLGLTGTNSGDQTITNTSDATSHTVSLSASGGSIQLIEGSNITLTTGGTASAGTVTIASTGGGGSGITRTIVTTSGSTTLGTTASTDYVYYVAGAHTLSMPSPNSNRYTIKNLHSSAITVDTAGAENIEGASSLSLQPNDSIDVISDGTNWYVH